MQDERHQAGRDMTPTLSQHVMTVRDAFNSYVSSNLNHLVLTSVSAAAAAAAAAADFKTANIARLLMFSLHCGDSAMSMLPRQRPDLAHSL